MSEEAKSTAEIFIRLWSDVDHVDVVEPWWPKGVKVWDKRNLGELSRHGSKEPWSQTLLRGELVKTPLTQFKQAMYSVVERLQSKQFSRLRDRPASIGADVWILFYFRSMASTLTVNHHVVEELAKHRMGLVTDVCLTS